MLENNDRENENKNESLNENTSDANEQDSTVGMKGVSGRVITANVSKVKRVKKADTAKKDDASAKTPTSSTTAAPKPRKIGNIIEEQAQAEAEKKARAQESAKAEEETKGMSALERAKAQTKAANERKAQQSAQKESAKPAAPRLKPAPVKPSPLKDLGTRPRKIKSAAQVEAEKQAAEEARQAEEAKKQAEVKKTEAPAQTSSPSSTKATPRKVTESGPRKLASGGKISTGGPRKISSGTDDSLAATAKAFAKQKEDKERRKSQNFDRSSGGRNNNFKRNDRPARNTGQDSYSPYDKDKDEDDKKQLRSQPRKPRKKTTEGEVAPDLIAQQNKNKFAKGKTRSRNFADERRNSKQREKEQEFNRQYREKQRRKKDESVSVDKTLVTHVALLDNMTVKEFAEAIARTSAEVIQHLISNGVMVTLNDIIDFDTATIIASEFDITTERLDKTEEQAADLFDETEDVEENLVARPPVVVVMGHVDHGKTTLLDAIRDAKIADGEAGGITQNIGAYMVDLDGRKITFLDTPGHEAFTTMRARGAQATDIAILVVAADDGVMPQTIEAINHAKAAGTEIIVAINKMDKPSANPDRIMEQLTQYGLVSEDWGGDTIMVPISAKNKDGIDDLLEMVLLTSDVMELKADPERQAKGIIIEAQLDRHRGVIATALIQRGTLKQGDTIIADTVVGNVRAMTNSRGESVSEAGPSVPVEILGLPDVPEVGAIFYQVDDERKARQWAEERAEIVREEGFRAAQVVTLDNLFSQIEAGKVKDFNVIIKADVVGSVEAMQQSLEKLSDEEIRINVIHAAAGAINESDVRLAEASSAVIIGFNVRPSNSVKDIADDLEVEIRLYSVIYKAIEEIQDAMKGRLDPEYEEVILGHVEIRETYKVSTLGTIGGGYVTDGKITRNSLCRVIRDGIVVHDGSIGSLRRFQDDVREVATGYECGLTIDGYNDLEVEDIIETYEMQEIKR